VVVGTTIDVVAVVARVVVLVVVVTEVVEFGTEVVVVLAHDDNTIPTTIKQLNHIKINLFFNFLFLLYLFKHFWNNNYLYKITNVFSLIGKISITNN
jgi:hypothetical protein